MKRDPSSFQLSLAQRIFVRSIDVISRVGYGVAATFHEDYVRTYGAWEYIKWTREAMRLTRELQTRYGEAEGQMVVSMAGLWSGCRWCSIAHMLIANLTLFAEEQQLGPIDERELPGWQELSDPEVLERLDERLVGRFRPMAEVARRMYELRTGELDPETDDDLLLARTNMMWEWIIECTIMALDLDPRSIPAWGKYGRDRKLQARYHAARGHDVGEPDHPAG